MTLPEVPVAADRARTWATVDLDAITHNVRAIRAVLPPATAFMAVVKADAYGHGAVPVAQAAVRAGATWLGVATPEEALALRAAGIDAPVLILGPTPEMWVRRVVEAECVLTVTDVHSIGTITRMARGHPRVHIKVDTGMTRLGVAPEALAEVLDEAAAAQIAVEGLYTHLACADEADPSMTREQLAGFARAIEGARRRYPSLIRHAASSAAALGWPEAALDMVRIGIALYGVPPAPHLAQVPLRPVMTLSSRVVRVRRVPAGTPVSYGATYRTRRATTIVTVPVGYADGYPRALGNVGRMVIHGRHLPVAGRVCMDYTMLDAGDLAVEHGADVTVFGAALPVAEVAAAAGTIAYELLCRVGPRVPRVYRVGETSVATRAATAARGVRSEGARPS
jgi:alanine racemase